MSAENSYAMSANVIQMVLDVAADPDWEKKPSFPITCSSLEHLNKIDSGALAHFEVLISYDENRCQAVSPHYSGQHSYGSSELNVAIDKEAFEWMSPDTCIAGTKDSDSPLTLKPKIDNDIVNVTDTETTNLVTNTPMNAIVGHVDKCSYATDDSNVLLLLTSVTPNPEVLASTSISEMPFKLENECDNLSLHTNVYGEDLNAPSSSYVSLDDDDVVDDDDNFLYTQVSLPSDSSSGRSRDGDYGSSSRNSSISYMEVNMDIKSRSQPSFIMRRFLCQVTQEAEHALRMNASKQENVEVCKPSSGDLVTRMKNWMTSLSDHTGHFKTLPDQCMDKEFSINNEELHSVEEQEIQQIHTDVSNVVNTPDSALYGQKKKKKLKMPKLKNPFKKLRKGQTESSNFLDPKLYYSTDEKPKKRSIFSRIFSSIHA